MGQLVRVGRADSGKLLFLPGTGLPSRQRKNKRLGTHSGDGRPYTICPGCSDVACLRNPPRQLGEHEWWNCESCGLIDCDTCPGGVHLGRN